MSDNGKSASKERAKSNCSIDSGSSKDSFKGGRVDTELLKKIFAKVQDPADWVDCETVRVGSSSDSSSNNATPSSTPSHSDSEQSLEHLQKSQSTSGLKTKGCLKSDCKDPKKMAKCPCKIGKKKVNSVTKTDK